MVDSLFPPILEDKMAVSCEKKTWSIERYARFIPSEKKNQGEWKYFSSYGSTNPMKISLVEPLKLIITSAPSIVLESIPLYGLSNEPLVKAICKGDSILFLCKTKELVRRFRVQFAKGNSTSERENCQDFSRSIAEYVQVKTVEGVEEEGSSQCNSQSMLTDASQTQLNSSVEYEYLPPNKAKRTEVLDSHIFSTKSIRQIAENLLKGASSESSAPTGVSLPEKEVDSMVLSCLLDPEFPNFVSHVEESLKRILTE